jgi:hypothetical protein
VSTLGSLTDYASHLKAQPQWANEVQRDTRDGAGLGQNLDGTPVQVKLKIDMKAPLGPESCVYASGQPKRVSMVPARQLPIEDCAFLLSANPYFVKFRDDMGMD